MGSTQNCNGLDAVKGFDKKRFAQFISSTRRILVGTCCNFVIVAFIAVMCADGHGNGGFYVSHSSAAEFVDASYAKTVDNTAPRNVSTQKGKINRAESEADGSIDGQGFQFGYRIPLAEDVFFLSGEIDYLLHSGNIYGIIGEQGSSEAPNQLGESWSENWTFHRNRSYGLTLKLGGSPGTLRSWKTGIYVIAGVRRARSRLDAYYNGCFNPVPCVIGDYESGGAFKDSYALAWTSGVGVEFKLVPHVWLEIEGRYTSYGKEQWVTSFPGLGVEVTSESANQTTTFRINTVIRSSN